MSRDQILDDALAAVRAQTRGSNILGDVIVSMPIDELRSFAGRLAILAEWAIDAETIEDLAAAVELVQNALGDLLGLLRDDGHRLVRARTVED
ncbi:MAG: hypothetical protein HGA44_18660, partial [Cellulomonadaceae bacterium]|nr:hypothetical protein [Cellulomonadaceae bacterium]